MPTYVKTNTDNSGWWDDGNVVLTFKTRVSDAAMIAGDTFTNKVTVTNATMACGSATTYATQEVKPVLSDSITKTMNTYSGGTTLTFNMKINSDGRDLIYNSDTLEILDVMSDKLTLATNKNDYFVVTDAAGNKLTEAASDKIGANEYYVTKVKGDTGKNTYKIIVPDGKALTIKYLVTVDAAVGQSVNTSNTAYFNYTGLTGTSTSVNTEFKETIRSAKGTTGASGGKPSFQIYKQDQWGNPIQGVTFELYKAPLNSDGTLVSNGETRIAQKTTDAAGYVTFDELDDLEKEDAIYYFSETSVPTGYTASEGKTYFYFWEKDDLKPDASLGAVGIAYYDKVFEVTNNFSSASLTVPLKKTINGKNQSSSNGFDFTLNLKSAPTGALVYTDEACTSANAVTSVETDIEGSGTTSFKPLYFNTKGTYSFTLAEKELTVAEKNEGFKKDDTVYTITVVVSDTDGLKVEKATYESADGKISGDLLKGDIPAFNNTLSLEPVTVTLEATKKLVGDLDKRSGIKGGEFTFSVVENGDIIAEGTTAESTTSTSKINFKGIKYESDGSKTYTDGITYTQDDLGTHYLTIYEDKGNDSTIEYSQVKFFAIVKVEPVLGKAELQADVTYSTQNKDNLDASGKPVFTNTFTYYAEGSLALEATKEMKLKTAYGKDVALRNGEFTFELYEDGKLLDTATNDANGDIKFKALNYLVADIGEHTYTIKEKDTKEMFVDYSTQEYTVTVEVSDAGNGGTGKLDAEVTVVNNSIVSNAKSAIKFTNIYTLEIPTGVRMYIMPYILIILLACGLGIVALICKQKRRKHHA
jgi:pilin isopeptide linkage protein